MTKKLSLDIHNLILIDHFAETFPTESYLSCDMILLLQINQVTIANDFMNYVL